MAFFKPADALLYTVMARTAERPEKFGRTSPTGSSTPTQVLKKPSRSPIMLCVTSRCPRTCAMQISLTSSAREATRASYSRTNRREFAITRPTSGHADEANKQLREHRAGSGRLARGLRGPSLFLG